MRMVRMGINDTSAYLSSNCHLLVLISGPFEGGGLIGGGLIGEGAYWRGGLIGGGGLLERGAYLFIQKTSDGDYLFELQ